MAEEPALNLSPQDGQPTTVSANPETPQRGQSNVDERIRSNDEQHGQKNQSLPVGAGGVGRPKTDRQEEEVPEASQSKKDQPAKNVKRETHASMLLERAKAAWIGAGAGEKWMIAFTAVIALVNIVYAGIGIFLL